MRNALSTAHTNSHEMQEAATYIQPGLPLRRVANIQAKKSGRGLSSRHFGFILGAIAVAFELRIRSCLDFAEENLVTCLRFVCVFFFFFSCGDSKCRNDL